MESLNPTWNETLLFVLKIVVLPCLTAVHRYPHLTRAELPARVLSVTVFDREPLGDKVCAV
jgi:hypothetical protein